MTDIKYPSSEDKDPKRKSIGQWIEHQRTEHRRKTLSKDRIRKLEQIPGWSWEPVLEQWDATHAKLIEFVQKNGFPRSPRLCGKEDQEKHLWIWITHQRTAFRKNELSKYRIRKLEQIPGWSWEPLSSKWNATYTELIKFVQKNKTTPSNRSKDPQEKILSTWVNLQRKTYKENKLPKDRIKKIEQIPGWHWSPFDKWGTNYEKLVDFVKKNKKLPIIRSNTLEEKSLGIWISHQRAAFKKSKLSQKRIEKLKQVPGWSQNNNDQQWDTAYEELIEFIKQNKKNPRSNSESRNERASASFSSHARKAYRKNKLSQERIKKLEQIPGWYWEPRTKQWDTSYGELIGFVKKNERFPSLASEDSQEKALAIWVRTQHIAYKAEKILQERIKPLENIPGWQWTGA